MLEFSSLLIRKWRILEGEKPHVRTRLIENELGNCLGCVRQPLERGPRWLSWLRPSVMEVLEKPDDSLLCSIRSGWSWHVADADEREVGSIRGRKLRDGFGLLLATLERHQSHLGGRFVGYENRNLGQYRVEHDTIRLTFSRDTESNPFARMMLLAAALTAER